MVSKIKMIFKCLLAGAAGFMLCYAFFPRTLIVTEYEQVQGDVKTFANTEVVYLPKEVYSSGEREKTDLQFDIAKTELNVKINGKNAVIGKTDEERYIFEKNKVALQQTSSATLNISVPVVDKTKYWGIGVGYGKNGIAGKIDFPINKSNIGGWVYGDKDNVTVGLNFKF